MNEGTVYANTGKIFFKIKQKNFRNNCEEPYWCTKVLDFNMGECFQNFSGEKLPCYLADVIETAICKDEATFIDWKTFGVFGVW